MAQINIPKRQQSSNGDAQLLSTIGTIAGTAYGGPAGGAAGGAIGGMLGAQPQQAEGPEAIASGGGAMQRRLQELDQEPLAQIRQGINSLQYIQDPQQRADLAKPLLQADYMARNKQQV